MELAYTRTIKKASNAENGDISNYILGINLHLGVAGFEPATLWFQTPEWPNKIQILPICNYLHLSLMVLYKNQSQIQPIFLNQILSIEN